MAYGNNGGLFIGALRNEDKEFLKPLLVNARQQGYTKFIEPCAGAMAVSLIAAEAGYTPDQIKASDVSLFSAVYARGVNGQTTEGLEIHAEGFSDKELLDPVTALYAQLYLRTLKGAGVEYFRQMLIDLKYRRKERCELIRESINRAAEKLKGVEYRSLDMIDHIEKIKNDPAAIVVMCPPTYTAGYEKFFDDGGRITWKEPHYNLWDVENGLKELYAKIENARALFIVYEEALNGEKLGKPIYGRDAGRDGMRAYLTSNRPEEASVLAMGKGISRKNAQKMQPLKGHPVLPIDYEITLKSQIAVKEIQPPNAAYYRRLWTHNFVGSGGGNFRGLFVDGYIAGVFGYDKMSMSLSTEGGYIFLTCAITPASGFRLSRLLHMAACTKDVVFSVIDDLQKENIKGVRTAMITKYPESKEMRGLMELKERKKLADGGYKLTYQREIADTPLKQVFTQWYQKEQKWQKNRKR